MKFTSILFSFALVGVVAAAPQASAEKAKWVRTLAQLKERALLPPDGPEDSFEMIGDLVSPGPTTSIGRLVADILLGKAEPQSSETYPLLGILVPPKGTAACAKDICCIWKYIVDEMSNKFRGPLGKCNKFARYAVRGGFHDAGAWEKGLSFGGADGSLVLANEITRTDNKGLEEIISVYQQWFNSYRQYGVSMADIIQMGATVATVVCPLGPRVRSFIGRKDSSMPNAENLLPDVFAPADDLIALFERKTIKPHGLTALVGAHTTSQQRIAVPAQSLVPQDSTPGVWDVLFYGQTLNPQAPAGIFKFPADVKFSTHPRMADEWQRFAGSGGQNHWNDDFAKEYVRLSLLGVKNINNMTECTKVLPPRIGFFLTPPPNIVDTSLGV